MAVHNVTHPGVLAARRRILANNQARPGSRSDERVTRLLVRATDDLAAIARRLVPGLSVPYLHAVRHGNLFAPGQQVLVNGRTWSYLINAHREVVSLSADSEEIDSVQLEYSPHWTGVARAIEVLLTPR